MLRLTTILALAMSLISSQAFGFEMTMDTTEKEAIQCSEYANQVLAKGSNASSPVKSTEDQKVLNVNQTI